MMEISFEQEIFELCIPVGGGEGDGNGRSVRGNPSGCPG